MVRPGYTLIELLVVIAILALVTTLATPATSRIIASMTLRSDANLIAAKLRRLERDAVRTQETITVQTETGRLITASGRIIYASTTTSAAAARPINFYPDGTTDGGKISLRGQSRQLPIEVAWLTGTIRIGDD